MLKTRISEFLDKFDLIRPIWTHDQNKGFWIDNIDTKCCFGAAVAKCFGHYYTCQDQDKFGHLTGIYALHTHLGLTESDLMDLLWLCGAHEYPFGPEPWHLTADDVLANLAKIEHQPTEIEFQILFRERQFGHRDSDKSRAVWNRITTN